MGKDDNPIKKLLSDDDKMMRDIMSKEMLKKIERRIDSKEDGAFKTIKEMLKREEPKRSEPQKKKPTKKG